MLLKGSLRWLGMMMLLLTAAAPAHAVTYYADSTRPDNSGDGLSWATAKKSLRGAIEAASTGDQVWARRGTYWEPISIFRSMSVYGGFAGSESQLAERNVAANPTIINASRAYDRNSAVLISDDIKATLDGFVVTGAFSHNTFQQGGGICLSSAGSGVIVSNCIVSGNLCSGISFYNVTTPKVLNCTISGNVTFGGGGIYCTSNKNGVSKPEMTNCVIGGNVASLGGGVYCVAEVNTYSYSPQCSPVFTNCIIRANQAADGAIRTDFRNSSNINGSPSCSPVFRNSIVADHAGLGIEHEFSSSFTLDHCLFWNNARGDFRGKNGDVWTGGPLINSYVQGAAGNITGIPLTVSDLGGQWAACSYDDDNNMTRISDSSLALTPGSLAGRMINTDTSQLRQALILDNTTTSVLVSGDLTSITQVGDHWQLINEHPRDGSAALDRGTLVGAPAADIEGQPRPGADGLVDIGAYEAAPGFAPSDGPRLSRIYVDPKASGSADGHDWANACPSISAGLALAAMNAPAEIWVAGGSYSEVLNVTSGVSIYGGFGGFGAGDETLLSQRNLVRNKTVLDGSQFTPQRDRGLINLSRASNTRLDGLTIVNAPLNGMYFNESDGTNTVTHCTVTSSGLTPDYSNAGSPSAIRLNASSPVIEDCIVSNNMGFGIIIPTSTQENVVRRCVIAGNSRAGIYKMGKNLAASECTITGNPTGVFCTGALKLTNCLINASHIYGVVIEDSTATLVNCTVSENGVGIITGQYNIPDQVTKGYPVSLRNTVLAANDTGFLDTRTNISPVPVSCLFSNNKIDISHTPSGKTPTQLNGAAAINAALPGAISNMDGPIRFLHDQAGVTTGTWDASGILINTLGGSRIYLSDAQAHFTPGSLAGRLICADANQNARIMILDNTTSTVITQADLYNRTPTWFTPGKHWALRDFDDSRPAYGSAAIDAGVTAGAPANDLNGKPRPVDIAGLGKSGTDTVDLGCYEAQGSGAAALIYPAARRLDFGAWNVTNGAAPSLHVFMINSGFQPLTFTGPGIRLAGLQANEFKFQATPATTPLAPGESRTITLLFDPTVEGAKSAQLEISTSDPSAGLTTISLTGRGINTAPIILDPPHDQNVPSGGDVSFSVQADGQAPLAYRWTRDGKDLANGGRISGADTARLAIKAATGVDAGTYACRVTNTLGTALSRGARLNVPFSLTVISAYGTPNPSGTITAASGASLTLYPGPTSILDDQGTTRRTLLGWKGTGSVPASGTGSSVDIVLQQNSTITWLWKTEYFLKTEATPATMGSVSPASQWVEAGKTVTVQANPAANYHLAAWSGHLTGSNPVASLLMNGPKTVTARFEWSPAAYGTVHVTVVPAEAHWVLTDSRQTTRGGVGCATIPNVPSGEVSIKWLWVPYYNEAFDPDTKTLSPGGEVQFSHVYLWDWGNSERTYEYLLSYLLGISTNKTGLDLNRDGKVDVADLALAVKNRPPTIPHNPNPANKATGVPITVTLDWADSERAKSYSVWCLKTHMSTTPSTSNGVSSSGLTRSAYKPDRPLDYNTEYYWQVQAYNGSEESHNDYWTFTTAPNPIKIVTPAGGTTWRLGQTVQASVQLVSAQTGKDIRFELWRAGRREAVLGTFTLGDTGGTVKLKIPASLTSASNYLLMAVSLKLEREKMPKPYNVNDGTLTLAP